MTFLYAKKCLRQVLLLAGVLVGTQTWAIEVGTPAPELTLPGLKQEVVLSKLKGKVVYVDFWASWCGPCKQSFPFMNDLQAKYSAQGLEILAINVDAKQSDATAFLAEVPAKFTVAFDSKGESAKRFGVKGMPSSYLIGRDGKLIAEHKGFKQEDKTELEARIKQAVLAK
jgi:cytochrome c biogenesis protein CcmG, thiol:disulfide interchange protein DsbE